VGKERGCGERGGGGEVGRVGGERGGGVEEKKGGGVEGGGGDDGRGEVVDELATLVRCRAAFTRCRRVKKKGRPLGPAGGGVHRHRTREEGPGGNQNMRELTVR